MLDPDGLLQLIDLYLDPLLIVLVELVVVGYQLLSPLQLTLRFPLLRLDLISHSNYVHGGFNLFLFELGLEVDNALLHPLGPVLLRFDIIHEILDPLLHRPRLVHLADV